MGWPLTRAAVAALWTSLAPAVVGTLTVAVLAVGTAYVYQKGVASVKPKVAVAEGQAAIEATSSANARSALTASSERHTVDVTIKAIERETGNVVAEARITGSTADAIAGWSDGIDRMRGVDTTDAHADPDERP